MPARAKVQFTQDNTQDIKLFNLQDIVTGQYWDAATASATLYDENGNATEVSSVTLNYVTASAGNYVGTVTTTFAMPVGGGYTLKIDATQGGNKFHLELPAEVIQRTS